jgi:hypothetical protein
MMRAQTIWAVVLCAAIGGCGGGSTDASGSGSDDPGVLEPPTDVHIAAGSGFSCTLAWSAPAQPVEGYEVMTSAQHWTFSDGDTHGGIAPGIATQAELEFSGLQVAELMPIEIQIRSRQHGMVSTFAPAVTYTLPVIEPQQVAAVMVGNGVSLTWFNLSMVATTVDIERAPLDASGAPGAWTSIASVPAMNAGEFLDQTYVDTTATGVGTAYGYRLSAIAPTGDRGISKVATSLARGAALADLTLQLPPALASVTDGNGHFAFYDQTGVFTWGNGSPWNQSPAIVAATFAPFVRLDAAGLPHAVYVVGGTQLTHGWSDGTQWHEETIAEPSLAQIGSPVLLQFDLDAMGAPVVVWMPTADHLSVATKVAGNWTVEALDALVAFDSLDPYAVFSDGTGVPHILISAFDGLHHLQRSGTTWTSELVPNFFFFFFDQMLAIGSDPDHLAVCVNGFVAGLLSGPICVRKTPAGWGASELLGVLPVELGGSQPGTIAMSSDGQQLAVLYQPSGSEWQLFRSTAGGAWSEPWSPRARSRTRARARASATPAATSCSRSPT